MWTWIILVAVILFFVMLIVGSFEAPEVMEINVCLDIDSEEDEEIVEEEENDAEN